MDNRPRDGYGVERFWHFYKKREHLLVLSRNLSISLPAANHEAANHEGWEYGGADR
jgi:hypothetical protein